MSAKQIKRNKEGKRTYQENFVNVRLKRTIHAKLKKVASKNLRSMANQIEVWVTGK